MERNALNEELGAVAEQLNGTMLTFSARASETGKLYGSITTQMIADEINKKTGVEINKRQVHAQPLRSLGEHTVEIRLTVDLVPEVNVMVNREGEEPQEVVIQEPVRPESDEDQVESEPEDELEAVEEAEELAAEEESDSTEDVLTLEPELEIEPAEEVEVEVEVDEESEE
jgi:large subunit ribosomal protein L9